MSNSLEAVIGAVYLDSDFADCRDLICRLFAVPLDEVDVGSIGKDPKTALQEYLQARKLPLPNYTIVSEEGQAHARKFTVECDVENIDGPVIATGKSKRNAEQAAASKMLKALTADTS